MLPFRSSFFAIAEGADPPLIQPVSVVYDRLGGLPTGRASRPVFAWYGDMDLASHFWRFAQQRGLRVTILLHAPLDPARFASRKALSHDVWQAVADGAAKLRQNRPVEVAGTACRRRRGTRRMLNFRLTGWRDFLPHSGVSKEANPRCRA